MPPLFFDGAMPRRRDARLRGQVNSQVRPANGGNDSRGRLSHILLASPSYFPAARDMGDSAKRIARSSTKALRAASGEDRSAVDSLS